VNSTAGNRGGLAFSAGLTIASAILLSVAYPPFNIGFLAWLGLAPFLLAIGHARRADAIVLGYLFGVVHGAGTYWWALKIDSVNIPNFIVMVIFFGLYFLLFAVLYHGANRRFPAGVLVLGPAQWVAVEYLRANLGFLAFPWCLLGHSQYRYLPVVQIADITGVYGVSFTLALVNQLLAGTVGQLLWKSGPKAAGNFRPMANIAPLRVVVALLVPLLVVGYGWKRQGSEGVPGGLRVAIVQPNRIFHNNMSLMQQVDHMRAYAEWSLTAARMRPHLIIWPASSLPAPYQARVSRFWTEMTARRAGSYLLVGGTGHLKDSPPVPGEIPYSNGEFLVSPQGVLVGQYNKVHLLPFNEYIPLQGIIPWPTWVTTLKLSFIPGKELTLFDIEGIRFGTPICWENMFPDFFRKFVARGAHIIVAVSSEAFFGRSSPAPYQTLAMSVFRAVENRVAIARAHQTGISAVIRPNGRIEDTIKDRSGNEFHVAGFLVADLPVRNEMTFYTRYGDLFAFSCIGLTAIVLLIAFLRRRKAMPEIAP